MTLLKKENSRDNAEWTSKKLLKIISADIKVDVKQRVIKELVYLFLKSFLEIYTLNLNHFELFFYLVLVGILQNENSF